MTAIRFYCDRHRRPHWVASYGRLGHPGARWEGSDLVAHRPAGVPVADPLPSALDGWPPDTWVELERPRPATARRRITEAGRGKAGVERLRAKALAHRTNPRDAASIVATPIAAGVDRRATFNNRCDRCNDAVPRRAENMAPLLDQFEALGRATGRDAFTLAELRDAAQRWDAGRRRAGGNVRQGRPPTAHEC